MSADAQTAGRAYDHLFGPQALEERRALGLPYKFGSYAWVVSPQRSASGNALLLGGPQMGFATPQIAHEIHLMAPGLNVVGMGFAGIPGVLIGHNERLAWTTTSGLGDAIDVFAERLHPEDKHRYLHNGKWREMECSREVIAVKGAEPVTYETWRTLHGPVVEWDEGAGVAYTWCATFAGRELETLVAILDFGRAQDVEAFRQAARNVTTSHNFLCATVEGDIGFWYCGRYPKRAPPADHRLPVPGTGEYDWQGMWAFEEQPQVVNPSQGFLANWNNKPAIWWDCSDTPAWGAVHRVQEIVSQLEKEIR